MRRSWHRGCLRSRAGDSSVRGAAPREPVGGDGRGRDQPEQEQGAEGLARLGGDEAEHGEEDDAERADGNALGWGVAPGDRRARIGNERLDDPRSGTLET